MKRKSGLMGELLPFVKLKNKLVILLDCLLLGVCSVCNAQSTAAVNPVKIGDNLPSISFMCINTSSELISLNDLKGKPVILDFWATWCQPCVAMLPKMNSFQKQFSDQVQILLVNNERKEKVTAFFQKMAGINPVDLPCAIEANEAFKRFGASTLPHYVWIDSSGKVAAFTGPDKITEENIQGFINGKAPVSIGETQSAKALLNLYNPLLIGNNGGTARDLKYHSILTGYLEGLPSVSNATAFNGSRIVAINQPIVLLYRMAYGSEYPNSIFPYNRTITILSDSAIAKPDFSKKKQTLYSYDLIIPQNNKGNLFSYMKQDLKRYFGLNAQVERRKIECLALIKAGNGPIRSAVKDYFLDISAFWLKMDSVTASMLASELDRNMQISMLPVLNETGIDYPFDIDIKARLSDPSAVKSQLNKHGLDLIRVRRELEVLILKD